MCMNHPLGEKFQFPMVPHCFLFIIQLRNKRANFYIPPQTKKL